MQKKFFKFSEPIYLSSDSERSFDVLVNEEGASENEVIYLSSDDELQESVLLNDWLNDEDESPPAKKSKQMMPEVSDRDQKLERLLKILDETRAEINKVRVPADPYNEQLEITAEEDRRRMLPLHH